jgi:hypothetical protein
LELRESHGDRAEQRLIWLRAERFATLQIVSRHRPHQAGEGRWQTDERI